jgi:SpoIID/LytB domain
VIRRISALLIGLAVCINLAWVQPVAGAVDYSTVRVMLSSMGTPNRITLKVEGKYSISQIGDELIDEGSYEIYVEGGQLILAHNSASRAMGSKFIFKNQDNSFSSYLRILNNSYGWTNYLGDMEVRLIDGGIRLINHVFLEYYLYGVVPYEMSNGWPLEALKAQAVAARTYAVRCKTSFSYFDLYDTENSQVYRGYDPSKKNAIQAVNGTFGMVSKYGTNFASTYYSSSNGGRTESCKNLWEKMFPI